MDFKQAIIYLIETVGETSVSSGRWGEDGDYGLAEAVHFHVATSALIVLKPKNPLSNDIIPIFAVNLYE
ncbi:MAG TPA: hypothetical protein PKY82_17725 [Pyrinomonadaceae bacterium]|nr:hypothetical protein [Pyrinomonadaceae bacterium]